MFKINFIYNLCLNFVLVFVLGFFQIIPMENSYNHEPSPKRQKIDKSTEDIKKENCEDNLLKNLIKLPEHLNNPYLAAVLCDILKDNPNFIEDKRNLKKLVIDSAKKVKPVPIPDYVKDINLNWRNSSYGLDYDHHFIEFLINIDFLLILEKSSKNSDLDNNLYNDFYNFMDNYLSRYF